MGSCADDAPITFSGMLDEEVVLYAKNGSDRAVDYLLQKYRSPRRKQGAVVLSRWRGPRRRGSRRDDRPLQGDPGFS